MDKNFDASLKKVLKHEGNFSNHPSDPGGATMKGVTLANFRRYIKPNATIADLKRITDEQIAYIYRRFYWDAVSGAQLPSGVDYAVFDFAVNSGTKRAAEYLQRVVGAPVDGKVGPKTLAAVKAYGAVRTINGLCDQRLAFLKGLRTWPIFGKGWGNRVAGVRQDALRMS